MYKWTAGLFVILTASFFTSHDSLAGPLTRAEVAKIINQVSLVDPHKGARPAALRDVVRDDLGVETGKRSRSELLFQDNTLTRLGSETFFSFKTGTRDMTLEKGSMLLQVPKGLGGAQIHTAAVTAAITGTTIMLENIPGQYIKVLVLEGSLRLSRNGVFGDSLLLHPGKMVIMPPNAKRIPDPIDVDLANIVKTSSLVNFPGSKPLPSMALIQGAIDIQQQQEGKGRLVATNLVMSHGTKVIAAPIGSAATGTNVSAAGLSGSAGLKGTPVSTSTVAAAASNLSRTASNAASIPVSSSTQIVSLLANATPNSSGAITINPTPVNNAVTTVAGGATSTANNVVTSVTSTVGNTSNIVSTGGNQTATVLSNASTVVSGPTIPTPLLPVALPVATPRPILGGR